MTLDSVDLTIWYAGIGFDLALFGLLVWKRVYRALPVFFAYIVWCTLYDLFTLPLVSDLSAEAYMRQYIVFMILDTLFQVAVWIELGWAVFRFNRAALPNGLTVISLMGLATLMIACIGSWMLPTQGTALRLFYLILRQSFEIEGVAVLLTVVWLSVYRDLRWPELELAVATGFGFSYFLALVVHVLRTHPFDSPLYGHLGQIEFASYLGTQAYWVLKFVQYDAKPQKYFMRA